MKPAPAIKPTHAAVRAYYESLATYAAHGATHEGATETAFSRLLAATAPAVGWTLIPKQPLKVGGKTIFPDGTLRDLYNLPRGYWEAKDTNDDLDAEIRKKFDKRYPLANIIFEDTRQAVLYQNRTEVRRFDLTTPQQLADLLNQFYHFAEPDIEGFEQAVAEFQERVPELARGLDAKVHGLLHHLGYRSRFADNLKRDLPRISFAPDFAAFAGAGRQLAELHLNYEALDPYPLQFVETPDVPLSYVVADKMKLSPDRTALRVNGSLTLAGIPPEVFDYRLGNRSALEWVIDQYRVSEDARSSIRSDPNRPDDPEYIVRLVGQVVRVSVETVKLVAGLPEAITA